jgi:hypothetical protein
LGDVDVSINHKLDVIEKEEDKKLRKKNLQRKRLRRAEEKLDKSIGEITKQ